MWYTDDASAGNLLQSLYSLRGGIIYFWLQSRHVLLWNHNIFRTLFCRTGIVITDVGKCYLGFALGKTKIILTNIMHVLLHFLRQCLCLLSFFFHFISWASAFPFSNLYCSPAIKDSVPLSADVPMQVWSKDLPLQWFVCPGSFTVCLHTWNVSLILLLSEVCGLS